jgi:hypothetical protein
VGPKRRYSSGSIIEPVHVDLQKGAKILEMEKEGKKKTATGCQFGSLGAANVNQLLDHCICVIGEIKKAHKRQFKQ